VVNCVLDILFAILLKNNQQFLQIIGRLDMEPLQKEASSLRPGADVLNGIAFDSANNKILVTGKRWPFVYEIKLQ
jgi:glutamine cyclotransferase